MLSKIIAAAATGLALGVAAQQNPISATTYQNILTYTDFSSAAYADNCAVPPHGSSVLNYIHSSSTGTYATVFKYPGANQIVLAFRGTATPQQFDYDLFFTVFPLNSTGTSCSNCGVHSGFQTSWNSVSGQAIPAVNAALAANPGYTLVITGHSLGGGISAMAAASFAGAGNNNLQVYTYGEPRNGNYLWTNYINSIVPTSNYYRVTHANDGVPQIPPTVLFFQHHGTEYWESQLNGNTQSTVFQCPGTENANCNNAANFGGVPINAAHISYSNIIIGNALNIVACGATVP